VLAAVLAIALSIALSIVLVLVLKVSFANDSSMVQQSAASGVAYWCIQSKAKFAFRAEIAVL
jgi:hypothetical protein